MMSSTAEQILLRISYQRSQKEASPAYPGYTGIAAQTYLPINQRRDLTESEEAEIEEKSKKFFRGPFASEGSPIMERMASPGKRAAALTAVLTLLLGGTGAAVGFAEGGVKGAKIGGGIGSAIGLASAPLSYMAEKRNNANFKDRMRRLPEGATIRDMMSDPAYQAEQQRKAMIRAARIASYGRGY